ncbi:MAG: mevalonate kinase family protein [bacterium]
MIVRTRTYARIGFMGNPSDGFFGKTISCAITNFCTNVTLWESPTLQIIPHRVHDPVEFPSLEDLVEVARRDGYYGGLRLLFATCKKFYEYCYERGIPLERKNFTVTYDTDIPRQVGLGGSSAIITATVRALMQFFGLTDRDIPKVLQPNLILSVEEEELDIRAGLQDRVIQVYGGTVFMDFSREFMEKDGYGRYEPLDSSLVPPLFLAYTQAFSDSGRVHSSVRHRFERGDREVIEAMRTFADYAVQAKEALKKRDYKVIAELMNKNFDLRRKIYGDKVIGEVNLRMIQIARSFGLPAKFSGSGGAIIGMYETEDQFEKLEEAYKKAGFGFTKVKVDPGYIDAASDPFPLISPK